MKFVYNGTTYDDRNLNSEQFELMKDAIKRQAEINKSRALKLQNDEMPPKKFNKGGK
jgi:hypothetical protein